MEYREAREYLQEITKYGSVLGLKSIKTLLAGLDNPQDRLKIVHIAGTNGKGSIFAFLQSILLDSGYNVGRYSSPAVFSYREIIKYNDRKIEKEELASCTAIVKNVCEQMVKRGLNHPTAFEVETAIAFLYFERKNCDIVLLETGMGGETDATNVAKKVLCSVLASISLDHTQFLGSTIEEITKVKCGIIKEGCPVVSAMQNDAVMNVMAKEADLKQANLIVAGKTSRVEIDAYITRFVYVSNNKNAYELQMQMIGKFQLKNAVVAVETAEVLAAQGYEIYKENIVNGIKNTFWPGRMEIINEAPLFVIDGAHNPDAAKMLRETVQMYFTNRKIAFIMGVLADKDYATEIETVADLATKIYTVTPNNARALSSVKLAESVKRFNENVEASHSIEAAVLSAKELCREHKADMVLAFGSLSYLSELKKIVNDANS